MVRKKTVKKNASSKTTKAKRPKKVSALDQPLSNPNSASTMKGNGADSFPIVAIGASAGGLHSLECFLEPLPKKFGFAIVFVQHLSPTHKSLMPELLRSKRPDLEFIVISDGLEVRPGKLYLCPPAIDVRIHSGAFRVTARRGEHVHFPIDEFFVSLAEETAERAIAVLFSGSGTDGIRGIQAVRTEGGTVFVQDPATAQFPQLLNAAIATGRADGVLSPLDIAREILKLLSSGAIKTPPEELITTEQLAPFYLLIHERTGYRFHNYKKSVVSRRIQRRMYLRGASSINAYLEMVANKDNEAAMLATDLMIGVTSFFRDRVAWKALRLGVIKKIAAEVSEAPIRVWTAACSTGEEAYSIAMMIRHELDLAGRKREIQVFATDVNDRVLEKAREGTYPASVAADIPSEYMRKFFTSSEDGLSVTINKEMRQQVIFAKQDLLSDPPFSRLDLVVCRNLLIYLEPDAQEKAISLFHYALRPGGYLFLGNAESTGRKSDLFRSLAHKKCRVYQKIETEPSPRMPLPVPFAGRPASLIAKPPLFAEQQQSFTHFIQEALIEGYAPAALVINQNYDILYHSGPTNRYLIHPRGVPTLNLLEHLPENERSRIRGAIYRASHEEKAVSIRVSMPGDEARKRQVSIRVSKLKENLFLLVFKEKGSPSAEAEAAPMESLAGDEPAVRQLESELAATRQELQSNIEQLKSLNEELQSSNEELQAANEELETSREELQSLNEELTTVNSQLQGKVEEQEETNNDLNNFLASTNIPTVFLDHRFRVKRFTPAMSRLLKLIPSDVGRPLIDMSQEKLGPGLIADAKKVLDNLAPVKKEMLIDDTWYVRGVLPYRTADDHIEGVVVTYNDVTELKKAEERTRHLASFPQLNPNPVLEVDASGKIIFANPGAERVLESMGLDKRAVSAFLPKDLNVILKDLDKNSGSAVYREVMIKDSVFSETVQLIPQFKVARIYAFAITERKEVEEALRLSEQKFALAFANNPAAIAMTRLEDGLFLDVNDTWVALNGYGRDEVIGNYAGKLPIWPSAEERARFVQALLKKGIIRGREQEFRKKSGEVFTAQLSAQILTVRGEQVILSTLVDITDRKKAEDALRESEQRLMLAHQAANIGAFEWNVQTGVNVWTPQLEAMYGLVRGEFGKTQPAWEQLVHPEDRAAALGWVRQAFESGEPVQGEWRVVWRDGSVHWIAGRFQAFKDATGKPLRLSGVNMDITERMKAEEALRESEARFRCIYESNLLGMIFWNMDGVITDANDKFLEIVGYDREDFAAGRLDWANMTPPEYRYLDEASVKELKDTGVNKLPFEKEYISKDGTRVPILIAGAMLDEERFNGVAFVLDITERERAEEALRKSEEQFRTLADSIPNLAWWANGDGYITWYNRRWYEYTGATPEQMEGWGWQSVHDPKVLPKVLERWKRSIATGEPFDMEFPLRGADGIFRSFLTRVQPLKDSAGLVLRWFGTNTDISALMQAEEELRAANEELTRFNRAAVGRELRMVELKREVNELCNREGLAPRYPIDFDKEQS